MFETEVWHRSGAGTLPKPLFSILLSAFTALGILFCLWCSTFTRGVDMESWVWWQWLLAIGAVLGCCWAGAALASLNDNPVLSALGYALVAGPMGLFLGPFVAQYSTDLVLAVGLETTALVVVLGLVGALIPKDLSGWGNWLFGGLIVLLIGMLATPLLGAFGLSVEGAMVWWNWAGIILFGIMVVYDVNRAMRVPFTVDNAIDCAVALFLDWVNLFIRLLAFSDS